MSRRCRLCDVDVTDEMVAAHLTGKRHKKLASTRKIVCPQSAELIWADESSCWEFRAAGAAGEAGAAEAAAPPSSSARQRRKAPRDAPTLDELLLPAVGDPQPPSMLSRLQQLLARLIVGFWAWLCSLRPRPEVKEQQRREAAAKMASKVISKREAELQRQKQENLAFEAARRAEDRKARLAAKAEQAEQRAREEAERSRERERRAAAEAAEAAAGRVAEQAERERLAGARRAARAAAQREEEERAVDAAVAARLAGAGRGGGVRLVHS